MDFEHWKKDVVKRVRFRPDRRAIGEELSAHYEDSLKDYLRIGYDEDLARARALRDLGDAEEVGTALDKAHKPWLGWLWMLSRLAVLLTAAMLVVNLAAGIYGNGQNILDDLHVSAEFSDYEADGPGFLGTASPLWESEWQRTALLSESPGEWSNGNYTVTVPYAAIWQEERPNGKEYRWLSMVLRAEKRCFWDKDLSMVPLHITDSNGRQHESRHWGGEPDQDFIWATAVEGNTLRSVDYRIHLILEENVDQLELGYFLNEDFALTLRFREVEE